MFSTKIFVLLACSLAIVAAMPGGKRQLSAEEIKEVQSELQTTLNTLASGDAPHYEISKIVSGTRQVVSGTMTKLTVELINTANGAVSNCNVSIWSRTWLPNGIETTIECAGQQKLVESHSA